MKFPKPKDMWKSLIRNKFAITFMIFLVWLAFFDRDNWVDRYQNIQKLEELNLEKQEFQKKIESDKEAIQEIKDPQYLEKFAREQYLMKKDNEDIYIIVED